ncbi:MULTISPECIES: glycosyltransferase family 2 protein [Luteibacter]|uniref:glycosyltransferase n=1 Tax=Luteibacter sp. dw_328 TaxID=2719796 RepID=UPI0009EF2EE1
MTERVTHATPSPRVQVFIPTYNRADRLEKAVKSVLGQSWPGLDVIVLDNHSSDHTPEVMQRLIASDVRVKHVRHAENIGMLANFNAIPALVEGDYFCMLTDDDTYEPGFLATALGWFETYPDLGFVACDAPTKRYGVVQGSQLDYWPEGRYAAGAGTLKCLLGHYPIITNCLFRAGIRDEFHFHPELGNTGDGFILTEMCANHPVGISRYVSGSWNNDGDNASSLQGFDAKLITRIAIAEYALYRRLFAEGRFTRRCLVVAWFKRGLSVLVAADRGGFKALRADTSIDRAFGSIFRAALSAAAATHVIRFFPWLLSLWRKHSKSRVRRAGDRATRPSSHQ